MLCLQMAGSLAGNRRLRSPVLRSGHCEAIILQVGESCGSYHTPSSLHCKKATSTTWPCAMQDIVTGNVMLGLLMMRRQRVENMLLCVTMAPLFSMFE